MAEVIAVTVTDDSGTPLTIPSGDINIVTTLAVITVTAALNDFGIVNHDETSIDANVQNFMVSGTDLLADITVAAPENFEVSLEAAANFMPSVALVHSSGALTGGTGGTVTVYVRFAPSSGDNGPVTGDITLNTSGAVEQTVSVMGTEAGNPAFTVTDTPLNDFGNVNNGANSASQMFTVSGENLTANITVTATDGFQVSLTTEDSGFATTVDLVQASGVLASTPVHVRFSPESGTNAKVTSEITLSTDGAENQTVEVTGTETAAAVSGPSFMVTEALTDFGTVNNNETSVAQNFTVSGTGLTADITVEVEATSGFEVSLEEDANFVSSVVLTKEVDGTLTSTVYVRFAPGSGNNGKVTVDITLSTTDAADQTVSVSGTEAGNLFTVTVSTSPLDFGTVNNNETSVAQNFTVSGTGLTADITVEVEATSGFEVSLEEDANFVYSVDLPHTSGAVTDAPVYVRFAPGSGVNGPVTADITLSTTGSASQTVSVSGTEAGNADTPSITVVAGLLPFGSVSNGETSESQSFDVEGANLTSDITVTAPPDFKVSLDNTAFTTTVVLPHSSGTVASTPVHVRFAPESGTIDEVTGDIVLSATGADEQTISIVGTATAAVLTGIGQESLKYNISVYPNPSEEVFHITIPESFGTGEIKLVSLDGAVVQKGSIGKMKQIETSNLRSGIYLLQILNATTVVNYRVVVK